MEEKNGTLVAAGLAKRFGAVLAVDNVDFMLEGDEAVGIVGPNGAGKTSLLNLLAGAYRPSAGTVVFCGANITGLDAADRCRQGIARSHQIPMPFGGMNVFENTYVAASTGGGRQGDAAYQSCIESLELCGMLRLGNRKAETLALLDRKRLELARALATNPKVLLLDEIGGGLTDAEASELVQIVKQLRQRGMAIVWIEHIVHVLVQVVQRLVCMDAGRIIADSAPDEVMANAAVIDAYLGSAASA